MRPVAQALEELGIAYTLGRSLASSLQGEPGQPTTSTSVFGWVCTFTSSKTDSASLEEGAQELGVADLLARALTQAPPG